MYSSHYSYFCLSCIYNSSGICGIPSKCNNLWLMNLKWFGTLINWYSTNQNIKNRMKRRRNKHFLLKISYKSIIMIINNMRMSNFLYLCVRNSKYQLVRIAQGHDRISWFLFIFYVFHNAIKLYVLNVINQQLSSIMIQEWVMPFLNHANIIANLCSSLKGLALILGLYIYFSTIQFISLLLLRFINTIYYKL